MPPKKGSADTARQPITAVVLADSFTQRFRPITIEHPKVLLPLVNYPMIEYTLEWLATNGVELVWVFCSAHADQVSQYLSETKWGSFSKSGGIEVKTLVSLNCPSAGEALRVIDQKGIIETDFILVSGDVVSNMNLQKVLQEHKARREKDKNAIMTLVMRSGGSVRQRRRLGEPDLIVSIDTESQRLLKYVDLAHDEHLTGFHVDSSLFSERDHVQVRGDLMDCQICVCAPEVLLLFSDNFDYQKVRRDFVTGVLSEEELGNKLFVYIIKREYAARVHNLRSYDAISRDILQRWSFPFVPDTNVLQGSGPWGASSYKYGRNHIYRELSVSVDRSACISHDTCIGAGATIGPGCDISSSVIGRDCRIGAGVTMKGSYLLPGVVVRDNARITSALVCDRAVIGQNAVVQAGCVVSYRAVISGDHVLPQQCRVSLCRQAHQVDRGSDDEREYTPLRRDADEFESELGNSQAQEKPSLLTRELAEVLALGRAVDETAIDFDTAVVGSRGAGWSWESDDTDVERAIFSLVPPPPLSMESLLAEELRAEEEAVLGYVTRKNVEEQPSDPEASFRQEVLETFLRCVKLSIDLDNVVLELNGLKIAEDRTFADCARYIFTTILELCLPASPSSPQEYRDLFPEAAPATKTREGMLELLGLFKQLTKKWSPLLQRFLRNQDDQVELLLTLEEFCGQEGLFASAGNADHGRLFAPIFPQVLMALYDMDIVVEEAFLAWAEEKENADEDEKVFLNKAAAFLRWLAEEDEDDDEDDED